MRSHAEVSEDGVYRYHLRRRWGGAGSLTWILLNPSTADGTINDPTIRRLLAFSRAWGYGGLVVVNLFALRATNPQELARHPNPVGPDNDDWIRAATSGVPMVLLAWGAHGFATERAEYVRSMLGETRACCLGVTKHGHPRHPLYVSSGVEPIEYS